MSDKAFAAFLLTHSVSGAKGDTEVQQQEEQQRGFNNQLQSIFSQQFGNQSNILNFLNGKLTAQVNNPTGFTPAQMAALNTNNTEGAASAFANAQKATQAMEASRGGSTLPSGVSAQLAAQNAVAGAGQAAQGANAIQLANAQQQQSNYWNALSGLGGIAQQENPLAYAGTFNQGSSTVGQLGNDYKNTQQSQLLAALGGAAAGAASGAGKAAADGG